MSAMRLPSGVYHQTYAQDHAWWQTRFVWVRMIFLFLILFVGVPIVMPAVLPGFGYYAVGVANLIGYTILSAMGVQLLIGYAGQLTLGHSAFIAVGGYTSAIAMLRFGVPYPVTIVLAAITAGLWSVLFGLPSARVKGYYLIMTTMAAQFITVDFLITQYVAQVGGRGVAFSLPPGTVTIGPVEIDNDVKVYYLMLVLVIGC
ncbi:MAG: branched-chain amino acid ABC transporter permease, partial [Chloroflexota bacterium]|nr:branched-chain amino acid ABC transporter permease [Chloroflexota bacterium]